MTIQKLPTSTIDVSSLTINDDGKKLAVDSNNALALIATDSPFFDLPKFTYTGSVAGYTTGGRYPSDSNTVDKYPFSSDSNATDVGDLTIASEYYCGQSSLTHGYATGGLSNPSQASQKFPFASDTNATGDTFTLSIKRSGGAGSSSQTHGYHAGGTATPGQPVSGATNIIDKFPFSADSPATDVGDLTGTKNAASAAGFSFDTTAYVAGGGPATDVIDRWSTISDGNATDVGELSAGNINGGAGSSSGTHGYHSGGDIYPPGTSSDKIEKFAFANESTNTDVGELTTGISFVGGGTSSTTAGYVTGGRTRASPTALNDINKFPFSSDSSATDIGNLTQARYEVTSNQSGITPIA